MDAIAQFKLIGLLVFFILKSKMYSNKSKNRAQYVSVCDFLVFFCSYQIMIFEEQMDRAKRKIFSFFRLD